MFQYDKRGPLYVYLYVSVKILEDPIDLYSRLVSALENALWYN